MLPHPNLDDRTYDNILDEARRNIARQLPEWTDENAHDPGITLLEMFAWLSEMQQYYLSRVPEKHKRKFLELLGVAPREFGSAMVEASFQHVKRPLALPRGTKLKAHDETFELASTVRLLPLAIEKIVVRTERETNDVTAANEQGDVAYYAFGRDAKQGSRLYIALDEKPLPGQLVTMSVRLTHAVQDDLRHVSPSARVSWKAYGQDEETGETGWLPLDIYEDSTLQMSYSGRITFWFGCDMVSLAVHPDHSHKRYWICCTLEEAGYEISPRIDRLLFNTAVAEHRDTLSETAAYSSPGIAGWTLESDSYLGRYGELRVQVRESGGWREWRQVDDFSSAAPDECCYTVAVKSDGSRAVKFGDGVKGRIPPTGTDNVRRIHSDASFRERRWLGGSNGLPGQRFMLYDLRCRSSKELLLQVGRESDTPGEWIWEDWRPVHDFTHSGPLDRHFVYNWESGEIRFGNDEQGAIPYALGVENLCLISFVAGGGERGNIQPHLLSEWLSPGRDQMGVVVTNTGYGLGGAEAESIGDCIERMQREKLIPFRAVTDADYAAIARSTPGLRVARVHVIPQYAPNRERMTQSSVTVVVVPDNAEPTPLLSDGFLRTVAGHLNERRLVATEVHVIAPAYVQISVHATVVVEDHFTEEHERIAATLRDLLRPLDKGKSAGWTFGRTVYKGDIYRAISRISGVAYVQDMWLEAAGYPVRKSPGGDVLLPPHGLVYSGSHKLELLGRSHV